MHNSNVRPSINKYLFAAIALFALPISGVSIDIYVPSLPAVGQYFHASKNLVQLSITAYMFGLGIVQLIGGAISDSYGRKKPFLFSMAVYILATLLIPFTHTIYQLLFLRFMQGCTVGMMVVPLRSIFPDLFEGRELYKMMNYMVMAWSIGPILAPAMGGYLQHYFGWKANFYFLAIYSSISFFLILFFVPETSLHRHSFRLKDIHQRFKEMLSHFEFLSGFITNGLLYSIIILFAIVGPFLIQQVLHYSAIAFGQVTLLVGLAWFLGATTNRFLVNVDFDKKANMVFALLFLISLVMVLVAKTLPLTIYTVLIPLVLLTWVGGIIFPNYFARGMALFPKASGSANALFGSSVFLVAGSVSGLATHLKSTTQLPLAIAYFSLTCFCILIRIAMKFAQSKITLSLVNE